MLFDGRYSETSVDTPNAGAKPLTENSPSGHPAEGGKAKASPATPPEDFLRMRDWIRDIQSEIGRAHV